MSTNTTNGHPVEATPEQDDALAQNAGLDPAALNAALKEAVRRAVGNQISSRAKEIAEAALEDALTPEVIEAMHEAADQAAAEALAPPEEAEAQQQRQLRFATVEEFVAEYVAIVYAREVSKPGRESSIRWCPQWIEHPEAEARFRALWRAFEHLRLGENVEMSTFWRDHLDHHMARLFDPHGPFEYCSVDKGHNASGRELATLPLEVDPAAGAGEPFEVLESGLVVVTGHRRGEVVWDDLP